MFMRVVQLMVRPGSMENLKLTYERQILPRLGKMKGCRFASLVQSAGRLDECISLTLWEDASAAEEYVHSGTYDTLLEYVASYLAETSEWKVKLSEDQRVEYVPVHSEPVVKAYNVTIGPTSPEASNPGALYVRILSIRVKPGKMAEFRTIYEHEILPTLYETRGCRYAYLTEEAGEPDDALSLTVWDRKEDADEYENGGRFESLVKKTSHLLAGLYQWKMSLGRNTGRSAITSEDMTSEGYHIVTGRSFV